MALNLYNPYLCGRNIWDEWDVWNSPLPVLGHQFGLDLQELRDAMEMTETINDPNKFSVKVDCSHFRPEEIVVKTKGNLVEIECNHEERNDEHGSVKRHFTRRYILPEGCEADKVVSSLEPNGILKVEAPKQCKSLDSNERIVPIDVKRSNSWIPSLSGWKNWFQRKSKL